MITIATALDYMQTSVQKRVIPYMMDQVSQSNLIMNVLFKNVQMLDGGDFITQPILTSLPTSMVIAYSGTETFPQNFQENEQGAVFDWKFYGISVDFTGPDETRNRGVAAALNLLRIRMQTAEVALKQVLGSHLYSDGTAFNGKAFLGFKAGIDDGTSVDNYGGVSRTAFPVWKAVKLSNGNTARALTSKLLDTATQQASLDSDVTNLYVGTPGCVTRLNQILQPQQRAVSGEVGIQGYKQVGYRGYPFISDGQIPTSPRESVYGLNTRYLQLYAASGRFFKWVPFQRQGGQDAITAKILIALALVVSRPASQFVVVDIDSTLAA